MVSPPSKVAMCYKRRGFQADVLTRKIDCYRPCTSDDEKVYGIRLDGSWG